MSVKRGRTLNGAVAVAAALLVASCSTLAPELPGPLPAAPARAASVPPGPIAPAPPPLLPADWREVASRLTLADVIDLALANSTFTRSAWLAARGAAAGLGAARADYMPALDGSLSLSRSRQSTAGGLDFQQTSWAPGISLSFLLLDLGGRAARVDQARAALLAADLEHSAAIQDTVLGVQQAYYRVLAAKAQLAAADASLEEARRGLDTAERRREVGVATIADVLQARTAYSRSELVRQGLEGELAALRGALATALGLPANLPIDVGELPEEIGAEPAAEAVEALIERALAERPELQASRWLAERATRRIAEERAAGLPSLHLSGNANRTTYATAPGDPTASSWAAALSVRVPLFTGFETRFDIARAREDAALAATRAESVAQRVVLDVWTSFYAVRTAAQQVRTSRDLLAAAQQSELVALARYREGVGTILDLLTAQASLADARAQTIGSRTAWLLAVAQLAHATGRLGPGDVAGADAPILKETSR